MLSLYSSSSSTGQTRFQRLSYLQALFTNSKGRDVRSTEPSGGRRKKKRRIRGRPSRWKWRTRPRQRMLRKRRRLPQRRPRRPRRQASPRCRCASSCGGGVSWYNETRKSSFQHVVASCATPPPTVRVSLHAWSGLVALQQTSLHRCYGRGLEMHATG